VDLGAHIRGEHVPGLLEAVDLLLGPGAPQRGELDAPRPARGVADEQHVVLDEEGRALDDGREGLRGADDVRLPLRLPERRRDVARLLDADRDRAVAHDVDARHQSLDAFAHQVIPLRESQSPTRAANWSGFSKGAKCPAPGMVSKGAPGTRAASSGATAAREPGAGSAPAATVSSSRISGSR